jgi:glutamate 5-kinase
MAFRLLQPGPMHGPDRHRIVIKVGTNTLTNGCLALHRPTMLEIVRQVAALHQAGHQIVLVSSGAIAAGREALNLESSPKDIPFKQVLAAVGQVRLMQIWDQLFGLHGLTVAQSLLTRADLTDRQRYLNARGTLLALLQRGVVPIVNENDVVCVEEIQIGDNDNLSALVANLTDADLLVLLTDTAGFFTEDPRRNASATLISEVKAIDDDVVGRAGGPGTNRGTGGMATKVHAARLATESGTTVVVAAGSDRDVIIRAAAGEQVGTRFLPKRTNLDGRRRWILTGLVGSASLRIDNGAVEALLQGRSLLPAGIIEVGGEFDRGETVNVAAADGRKLACGVANYAASNLARLVGHRSHEIEHLLGFHYGDEAIHRSNMVVL